MEYNYRGYSVMNAREYLNKCRAGRVSLVCDKETEKELIPYLTRAVDKNSDIDMYAFANVLYSYGDLKEKHKAFKIICDLSEKGFVPSYNQYGIVLSDGICVDRDYAAAVRMFEKASKGGFIVAVYNLGYCYLKGLGVKADYEKGIALVKEAAEYGLNRALHALGVAYYKGDFGFPQDFERAYEYFSEAAMQEHPKSLHMLAGMLYNGEGCERNPARALNNYKLAAVYGVVNAQAMAAEMLCKGKEVTKDLIAGCHFLEMAANNGDVISMYNLGVRIHNRDFYWIDASEARGWIKKAADAGDADAKELLKRL